MLTVTSARHYRIFAATMALALVSCGEQEEILPGKRLHVRAQDSSDIATGPSSRVAFSAPAQSVATAWTHKAGGPQHRIAHQAFSASPRLAWSADIGEGNRRRNRITADPVVAADRVFTLDSLSNATATSTDGRRLWSVDLTPSSEKSGDASSGGLAIAGNSLYVTTGYGEVHALDADTGGTRWKQRLDAAATGAPTVHGGLVYLVTRDNTAWGISADNGRVRWRLPGTPSVAGLSGASAPAVTDGIAVFPFGSGEVVGALPQGGVRLWGSSVSGQRRGRVYARISDITADPVILGDVIYTGNQSGRAVAMELHSGERIWTAEHGPYEPVWVAGGSIFLVSDQARLVRLNASTGETIWAVDLPYFRRDQARRRKGIFAHYGPVLAGGRLWVASDNGDLNGFDPATGEIVETLDIPGGAASNIAVANRTMYLVSAKGNLLAYR